MLCSASVSALQIMFNNNLYESIAKWETFQIFKEDIVGVLLPGGSVTKTGLFIRYIQSNCFQSYDDIHKSWEDIIS